MMTMTMMMTMIKVAIQSHFFPSQLYKNTTQKSKDEEKKREKNGVVDQASLTQTRNSHKPHHQKKIFLHPLKMLLPKLELDLRNGSLPASPLDVPSRHARPAKVNPDLGLQAAFHPGNVTLIEDAVAHGRQQPREMRPPKVGPGLELGEGILVGADRVEHDVVGGVHVDLLGEVGVDPQKVLAASAGPAQALGLEARQQRLEPLERGGVLADPDELDATEDAWVGWATDAGARCS